MFNSILTTLEVKSKSILELELETKTKLLTGFPIAWSLDIKRCYTDVVDLMKSECKGFRLRLTLNKDVNLKFMMTVSRSWKRGTAGARFWMLPNYFGGKLLCVYMAFWKNSTNI